MVGSTDMIGTRTVIPQTAGIGFRPVNESTVNIQAERFDSIIHHPDDMVPLPRVRWGGTDAGLAQAAKVKLLSVTFSRLPAPDTSIYCWLAGLKLPTVPRSGSVTVVAPPTAVP